MKSIQFNAHHSPIGAFASLTLGFPGAKGGLGHELKGPADEPFYVGLEERDRPGHYQALPFFDVVESKAEDYDVEGHNAEFSYPNTLRQFEWSEINRTFGAATDTWQAVDLTFRIISGYPELPDPESGAPEAVKFAITPGVLIEIEVDNTQSSHERKVFLGYQGSDRQAATRIIEREGLLGIGQGTSVGIATKDPGFRAGVAWQPEMILNARHQENPPFLIGSLGLLNAVVPAGEKQTFHFAIGFFREGTATTGISSRYLYRRYFDSLEGVLTAILATADERVQLAQTQDEHYRAGLSEDQSFMLAHAIRSYYGATELLENAEGKPIWLVNEGEYRMLNTLDLTMDQLFFELKNHPWTVRNELDLFVQRYSYHDQVFFPGDPTPYPGGISFSHDMGVSNNFSPPGHSSYEQGGLKGCFSYMTAEELLNWSLCACIYARETQDLSWLEANKSILQQVLTSLENRDHPVDAHRNGVIGLDSSRCLGGAEITTYDSLDVSLGQARNNLYLAVKGWAAYLLLAESFAALNLTVEAARAQTQADRAARTVTDSQEPDGTMPAIIGEGVPARLIPAIEGLAYVSESQRNQYPFLLKALTEHLQAVLKDGICKFDDGGWKLSSTSNNSWLSKIYLCQHVATKILGIPADPSADAAHVGWLLDPENAYFAWSDQMLAGKACGSRYYPRGVTAILWLDA